MLLGEYNHNLDVKGRVKISSQKAIVKPARNGDLLFTKDNISTETIMKKKRIKTKSLFY